MKNCMPKKKEYKYYTEGKVCERCGMEKAEAKRLQFECNTGMKHYGNHLWNKEPLTIEVQYIHERGMA